MSCCSTRPKNTPYIMLIAVGRCRRPGDASHIKEPEPEPTAGPGIDTTKPPVCVRAACAWNYSTRSAVRPRRSSAVVWTSEAPFGAAGVFVLGNFWLSPQRAFYMIGFIITIAPLARSSTIQEIGPTNAGISYSAVARACRLLQTPSRAPSRCCYHVPIGIW